MTINKTEFIIHLKKHLWSIRGTKMLLLLLLLIDIQG